MPDTFVLITGPWRGGWLRRPVAERSRAAGPPVLTPTSPGPADGANPTGPRRREAVDALEEPLTRADPCRVRLVGHVVARPSHYLTKAVEPLDVEALAVPASHALSEPGIASPPSGGGRTRLGVGAQPAPGGQHAPGTQPAGVAEAPLKA